MIEDILQPISGDLFEQEPVDKDALWHKVNKHLDALPLFEESKVVLLGVRDARGDDRHEVDSSPDLIRRELYKLFEGGWGLDITDIGDIHPGETLADTHAALAEVCEHLLKNNCIPIIIGGSQDLTFANYKGYEKMEQMVNMVSVDPAFDLGAMNAPLQARSYLSHIVLQRPNYLFNYSNLGYQTYFVKQEEIALMDKMFFETYRLGNFHGRIREAEPILRDADIVSVDVSSVRASDAPGTGLASPNGFSGEELCAIARYAGMSDKTSSFGIYGLLPYKDDDGLTAKLMAQTIWYFIEGISFRKNDYPFGDRSTYSSYIVPNEELDMDLKFYKSDRSGRWWMEIPLQQERSVMYKRHVLVPCSYDDYLKAADQEIPDRWWKAYKKLG